MGWIVAYDAAPRCPIHNAQVTEARPQQLGRGNHPRSVGSTSIRSRSESFRVDRAAAST